MKNETVQTGAYQGVAETLWLSYRPFLKGIIVTITAGLLGRAFLLYNANLIGHWVDSLCFQEIQKCPARSGFTATWENREFLIALFVLVALGFLFSLLFRVLFSKLSALAVSQLYDETTLRTSRFPMSFFDRTPVGRVVTRFSSDYGNVFRMFGGPLSEFLTIIFDLVCMVILAGFASPFFIPVVLVFLFFHGWLYRRNRTILQANRRELSASRSPSIAHFAETAQGASTIRTFNKEGMFSERFNMLDELYLSKKWKTVKSVMFFSWQNNILTGLMFLLTGFISWELLSRGYVTVGAIGVAFSFITFSGNTVLIFFEWLAQFEEALVGVERMNGFLRHEIEPGSQLPMSAQFQTGHSVEKPDAADLYKQLSQKEAAAVKFSGVSFRYGDELPWVLQDFDLEIKAGEKIGVIGRTGSGKSTLTQVLLHLYPLAKGNVEIEGVSAKLSDNVEGIPLSNYRRLFSFISQDPVLFRGTLRENLDFTGQQPVDRILECLKTVGLGEWANKAQLESEIEERGRNVSFGEKQLICLARALLQNAPVVIMDEATSAVDPQSEEILVQATEKFFRGKTQILIAHRLSTLASCDRIVWLQKGRIKAEGKPEKVLAEFEKTVLQP